MRFVVVFCLTLCWCQGALFGADALRPSTARWLPGDRILVLSDAPATVPWITSLTTACATGLPVLSLHSECSTGRVSHLFRKAERMKFMGEVVVIAVGSADAKAAEKSRKDVIEEFQRRVAAYATGVQAMGGLVVLVSTSDRPAVLSAVRAAAAIAKVEVSTPAELEADLGKLAGSLPPRILITGDRSFISETTLAVSVKRIDPKTAKLRWWLEPGNPDASTTQAITKPIRISRPGLVQVRVTDPATGVEGKASVFLRKMEFLKPVPTGKLVPGWTWRSGVVPLAKGGELLWPTAVSGVHSGKSALAEWPAAAGEAPTTNGSGPGTAAVVVFDGYLVVRQQGMYRFIAKGAGALRLDIGDQLVLEHPSHDTIDGATTGGVPLVPGHHHVRLMLARFQDGEPATVTCLKPKSTIDEALKLNEIGSLIQVPVKTR